MIKLLLCLNTLLLFSSNNTKGQPSFQLATPLVKFNSAYFNTHTQVELIFDQPGTNLYFTTNGDEPSLKSKIYKQPIDITSKLTVLKVKASGKDFLSSETQTFHFFRKGIPIKKITGTLPSEKYKAKGLQSLFDLQGGKKDISNQQWLGYEGDSITWTITLNKNTVPKQLLLQCLQLQGSWIFLPHQVQVYSLNSLHGKYYLCAELVTTPKEGQAEVVPLLLPLKITGSTNELRVICKPLSHIPSWHAASGNKAWFFADEIIIY